jgi:hypothetical protein
MAIEVTCPGCTKSFKVSDQFAGKKGPCPNCKTVITIPASAGPAVVIHAPDTSGPKGDSGAPVLKPIRRKDTKATPALIATIVVGAVLAIIGARVMRFAVSEPTTLRVIALAFGALVLAPLLVFGGYSFLRDQELEPYRGRAMIVRVAICSAVYAVLWAAYAYLPPLMGLDLSPTVLAFVVPLMVVAGAFAAFASLDLDYGAGAMHYGLYLLATVILCFVANVQLWSDTGAEDPRDPRNPKGKPSAAALDGFDNRWDSKGKPQVRFLNGVTKIRSA